MATRKKTPDASEVGLSAIEQAFGLSDDKAKSVAPDASPALPKVDDFDIFKAPDSAAKAGEAKPVDAPRPDAALKADKPKAETKHSDHDADVTAKREAPKTAASDDDDAPFRRITPRRPGAGSTGVDIPGLSIRPEAPKAADMPKSGDAAKISERAPEEATVRLDKRPVEAAEPETRRAAVLPANDDRRASVAELLEPLRNPAPRTPYFFAFLISLVWLAGAYLLFSRPDGLFLTADGAMRTGLEGLLILTAVATLLPVMFFFALASLQRRSREMRTTSRVMAEVAARLVEPEVPGSETVFTLGQAVRREVTSIGDGIDRAVTRATELEGLVHGEVTALERSYADNEYKMRTLVTGLTAEREAIMATAERIRLTIDAAHQGFSADIEKASSSISGAIDDAGTRVSFLLGGKQDELVATLDRTANHASELIQSRSTELSEKVNAVTRDTADALTITGNSIISDLTRVAQNSTTTLAEQTAVMAREIDSTSQRSLEAMRASGDTLIQDWRAATEASQIEIAGIADQSARLLRDSAETSASTIRTVADEATTAFRSTADDATTRFSAAATDSASLVTTSVEQAAGDFTKAASSAATFLVSSAESAAEDLTKKITMSSSEIIGSAEKAAGDFSTSANATASLLTSSLESATDTFRSTGEALKSEIGETASIVNSAFETNSRAIIEQIGSSAIQLNDTMQQAGLTFISTIEERGNTAAERIEEAGNGVAVRIAEKSDQLSNHASLLATHISNGTTKLQTLLEGHEATIATSFETASGRLDGALSDRASRLDQSLAFRATAIEQVLSERVSALDHTLAERASAIEAILAERVDTLDQSLAGHAVTLANIVENRVTLANEAFAIAGESLGALISDRTRESSLGLKSEIDELGLSLAQQSAQATERLATTGRDVVQAMTAHGQKVNDALAANAMRLAETVSERTAGLSERFSGFEKTFIEKAAEIETTVSTHGETLVGKIENRTETLTGNLESLVARIETGLDGRTKSLGDAIALRAIEFNRLVGENSATLLGGLDERVGQFTSKVVTPLEAQLAAIEGRTTLAAETLTSKLDQSSELLLQRAGKAADEISVRMDRSTEAINLRVSEVQRGLTDLSRNVSSELVGRADEISNLFDTKGSGFLNVFETRASTLVSSLEASTGDLTQRVTTSLEELNSAITSGSESSLGGLVDANNRLKSEVSELLGRLGEANGLLNTIVGAASQNLTEVESRMSERVRGLESTLAAILSAANNGSDALVKQVDQIRSASGDVLRHSQGLTQDLDGRAATLQRLASDLANSQAQVAQLVGDRQDAFETLATTLQSRIEDVDNMLRSFSALVDEQLGEAQTKARDAAALVHETAETAAQSIGAQYDRLRLESGKERERTAVALRSTYDQANGEMSTLFQRATDGFMATAAELRQATREMMADLEATRAAVSSGGLEIPREVREATANLKRVVSDQSRALNELSEIVSRSNAAFDVAEPRQPEPRRAETPPTRLAEAELPRLTPQRQTTRPPAPTAPREMPRTGGGSWLSGLLERASDEPAAPLRQREPAPSNANRIESLDSLSVDIARMIDHEAAVDLWDRYRKGERNVFTRRLYTLQGQEAYDDIRRRYKRDTEFKRTTDAYLDQFERLLQEVAGDDRDNLVARTYLTSDTGKVYTMLAHAAGRFD